MSLTVVLMVLFMVVVMMVFGAGIKLKLIQSIIKIRKKNSFVLQKDWPWSNEK